MPSKLSVPLGEKSVVFLKAMRPKFSDWRDMTSNDFSPDGMPSSPGGDRPASAASRQLNPIVTDRHYQANRCAAYSGQVLATITRDHGRRGWRAAP